MERLLQQFEGIITARDGETYVAYLYGRSRPADTWQGWLVFERVRDGQRFATDTETTQPNAQAIIYWATGLTDAYFDGALDRALRPSPQRPAVAVTLPDNATTRSARLAAIENEILAVFRRHRVPTVLTQVVLDSLPHAHADVVRALEILEKQPRLLVRRTEEGSDWLFLTEEGLRAAGLAHISHTHQSMVADPPNSAR